MAQELVVLIDNGGGNQIYVLFVQDVLDRFLNDIILQDLLVFKLLCAVVLTLTANTFIVVVLGSIFAGPPGTCHVLATQTTEDLP